jgi:polyphosphate kinase
VELIAPIKEPALRDRLIALLDEAMEDNRLAWDLDAEGHYTLRYPDADEPELDFHETLMKAASRSAKKTRHL